MRLNRRLCPDVYVGVVDVVEVAGRPGEYAIGGPVRPVEPAVRMRRLPGEDMLPTLLARDAVDARLVGRVAERLPRFHADAATGPGVDEWGTLDAVRGNWEETLAQVAPFVGRVLSADHQATIAAYVGRFLAEQGPLLERRVATGRIREGHGARLAARERDPLVSSDARLHLWPALRRAYSAPGELPGAVPIDMTAPLAEAVDRAVARLAEGRACA